MNGTPGHVSRVLEALSTRGIDSNQLKLTLWTSACPICEGRLEIEEVSWNDADTVQRTRLCCLRCEEQAVLSELGLRERDVFSAPIDSDAPSAADPVRLRFVSAADLKADAPPEPTWLLNGYIYCGGLTWLSGRPKVGKSKLVCDLAAALVSDAETFLGREVAHAPVVYVSEEGANTLAPKLPASDQVRVLTRESAWPKPDLPTLIDAAVIEAAQAGAQLLIVDTLPWWAGMPPEQEKDAGAARAVMETCALAAGRGLAVLLPGHARKGGGDEGEAIRGSSAFAGAVDIIIEVERVPDAPRQRALLALSRYPQTPGTLVAELAPDGESWRLVSEDAERSDTRTLAERERANRDREALIDSLGGGRQLTRAELEDETGTPARQWYPVEQQLIKDGILRRTGAGKKGDPYRFELAPDSAQDQAAQHVRGNGKGEILVSAHSRREAETESSTPNVTAGAQCAGLSAPDAEELT